jgi:H+/gluconate symporter-like permease
VSPDFNDSIRFETNSFSASSVHMQSAGFPLPTDKGLPKSASLGLGVIIGIIISSTALIAGVISLACVCRRRKVRSEESSEEIEEPINQETGVASWQNDTVVPLSSVWGSDAIIEAITQDLSGDVGTSEKDYGLWG